MYTKSFWYFAETSKENTQILHLIERPSNCCQNEINRYIFEGQNVIRPEWFGFDNIVEYKLDNLIQP